MCAERTLQVPINLDAEALVGDIRNKGHRANMREACLYVAHYLSSRLTTAKGLKKLEDFGGLPIHVATLRKVVGRNASKALTLLTEAGVIYVTQQYCPSRNSKCYLFGLPYLFQPLRDVVVHNLSDEHVQQVAEVERTASATHESGIEHLFKHLAPGLLSVDMEAAHFYLETLSARITLWHKAESAQTQNAKKRARAQKVLINTVLSVYTAKRQLLSIERDDLLRDTSRALSNLRLHSPVVGLKKQLRSFLRYQNGALSEVDMGAAQPYLLLLLLNPCFWSQEIPGGSPGSSQLLSKPSIMDVYPWLHDELAGRSSEVNTIMMYTFGELAASDTPNSYRSLFQNGDFYENLVQLVHAHPALDQEGFKTRKQAKKTMMYLLFGDFNLPHNQRVKTYQTFKALFPRETQIMDLIKRVSSNALAILLQRLEAVLMLERLTKIIDSKYPGAGLLTIHDAILTQCEYAEAIRTEMEQFFYHLVGVRPAVKINELSGDKVNAGIIEELDAEIEAVRRKVRRKSYQSIQEVFSVDDSQLLRPHVPTWEDKTASTERVVRKLADDPARRARREIIKESMTFVAQKGLTTAARGNYPIRIGLFSISSSLSTTWRPTLSNWEIEPPLYCLTPTSARVCSQLTDALWSQLSPLLPGQKGSRGVTAHDTRGFVEALLWLGHTGAKWRDLPSYLGDWHRVYVRYSRWQKNGVCAKVSPLLATHGLVLPQNGRDQFKS